MHVQIAVLPSDRTIFSFGNDTYRPESMLHISIVIENRDIIARSYGNVAAEAVMEALRDRAAEMVGLQGL